MALPGNITLTSQGTITTTIYGFPSEGKLIYKYAPFKNLQEKDPITGSILLKDLRLLSKEAGLLIDEPIILDIEEAYDGSANLIISDKNNPLKLVNSRFYLLDSTYYKIADRKGNLDTNIYTRKDFKVEAGLIKTVRSVISLDFEGVFNGGRLPIGNYNFYFKLADFDGNETDFIAESGQVVCYIGDVNNPSSIRGGQLDENSEKLIKFKLNNLDLAYDFINIYYTRNTGEELSENSYVYKIINKFKITGSSTSVTITGYEELENLTLADLNLKYASFDEVKTITSCQNMVFAGNVGNNYELFSRLEQYSLYITPTLSLEEEIGNINNNNYLDSSINNNEYYNPKNIYYRLGYWDEEIYRLGIVYILNDFTLSPVFNIRGKINISTDTLFKDIQYEEGKDILIDSDYNIIYEDVVTDENSKGVIKLDLTDADKTVFNGENQIKPIGVKLSFHNSIFNPSNELSLEKITKGFFIVRQKRIPTIVAQGVSIGTSKKGYIPAIKTNNGGYMLESFLTSSVTGVPKLGRDVYNLSKDEVRLNAILCPEASIRKSVYKSLFNSSTFKLRPYKYQLSNKLFEKTGNALNLSQTNTAFINTKLEKSSISIPSLNAYMLLLDSETSLINNKDQYFSSTAGNEVEAWKHTDPIYGDIDKIEIGISVDNLTLSRSSKKTRGIFNSYVGVTPDVASTELEETTYYNIYNKDYSTEISSTLDYFKVRYNDSSPFFPISDRTSWDTISNSNKEIIAYRGDCYISTYTHRMIWNFTDPELPTNKKIVDPYTWYKNYKVKNTTIKTSADATMTNIGADNDIVIEDNSNSYTDTSDITTFTYRKVINTFTYKVDKLVDDIDIGSNLAKATILTPDDKKYKKYAESNGEFGTNKINRPDVNAIGLGHWVTFKICSNINLALRDEDFNNPAEEAIQKRKRSFFPYSSADINNSLPESNIINKGISTTLGNRAYFEIPDVPFIKTNFNNRIYYSNLLIDSMFKDGSRVFESSNYQDYTMEYGQLVKLVEWKGTLIAIMEHGILMIPVNERALMTNATGDNVYVNTENVLPKNPRVISNTFGSTWHDSIVKTPRFIYGIDTIAKKIWKTDGQALEIISDMKIQKFLNDNILLKVTDKQQDIVYHFVKTHYNAFKHDLIFTFKYGLNKWSICWNEISSTWVTRYTWFPEFSENINNIFYTFANKLEHPKHYGKLFKHGWAGTLEEQGYIKPTLWYEEQHPFEFEFVVTGTQGVQKVYNNLKIISNKAEPNSFSFEVVGEGYDWYKYKEVISWMENNGSFNTGFETENLNFFYTEDGYYSIADGITNDYTEGYKYLLTHTMDQIETDYPDFPRPANMNGWDKFIKLPYIPKIKIPNPIDTVNWETLNYDTALINDKWNGEDRVLSYQKAKNMTNPTYGRLKGNMHYVEDSWDIQIQPIKIRYAFIKNGELKFSSMTEMKIRDKYIKIRVKYDGKKLVIINALRTLLTLSYA